MIGQRGPWGTTQAAIGGDQRDFERLYKSELRRVVRAQVFAQLPDSPQQTVNTDA